MAEKSFFDLFPEEAPAISKAFGDLMGSSKSTGGLDEKTFELVFIGIKASCCSVQAAAAHAGFAKKAGATREEVRGAVLVSLLTSGIDGASQCLAAVLDAYDKA